MKVLVVSIVLALAGCASGGVPAPETLAELAPQGKIRVAVNHGNPVLAKRDGASGELRGVAVDIGRELGRELEIPVELVPYGSAAALMAGMKAGEWDVAFAAIDPARQDLAFSAAYMQVEVTYLVPAGSDARSAGEVDRPGLRIAVQARNAADLFLTRELRHAALVRTASMAAGFGAVREGSADAFADNRQHLVSVAAANPGYRIVDGGFSWIRHALAVPASHRAAAARLEAFIEGAKARGLVKAAIDRAELHGVTVAP